MELLLLTQKAKEGNQTAMLQIIEKFKPLIIKYSKKLFFMTFEDASQELIISLIEAIYKMEHLYNEEGIKSYIHKSVTHKYCYLCKQNIKMNVYDNGDIEDFNIVANEPSFENDSIMKIEIQIAMENLSDVKQKILRLLLQGYSDTEIAKLLKISRQYVNRVKKEILLQIDS